MSQKPNPALCVNLACHLVVVKSPNSSYSILRIIVERTLAGQTPKKVGKKVKLAGWVVARRDHGKLVFTDFGDRSGVVQVVGGANFGNLHLLDVIEIEGEVVKRAKNLVNPKLETGEVEVAAQNLKVIATAQELPFDIDTLQVSLPTLLDNRSLTLRNPKVSAIFKVQETIIQSFRKTLTELDFTEIQVPTIVPAATEGGAEVFKIDYYGYPAYLAQSPQLYKQIMVGVYERVFTLAHAYRAEPSETTRHLSEYISLDGEMGFIESWQELMDVVEKIFVDLMKNLKENCPKELSIFNVKLPKIKRPIPKLKLRETQEIIFKRTGRSVLKEPDLSPDDEREICQWSKEVHNSDLIFITHFPTSKRPFYTYHDPADPDYTLSFDLLGLGLEWVTGSQRINDYNQLVENIKKWGNNPADFGIYLQAFKYGMPSEGGFAIGAERVTMKILGLENVKEASLFPRDMTRIDLELAKISKKRR